MNDGPSSLYAPTETAVILSPLAIAVHAPNVLPPSTDTAYSYDALPPDIYAMHKLGSYPHPARRCQKILCGPTLLFR